MKGKFIVFEGIDGCGKTTQINHLKKWLPESGLIPKNKKLHITREPGGTLLGKELREILLNPLQESIPDPLTELLLYTADRAQHIAEIIMPALNKGDWIMSDRFSGSTLAYQGYGRKLDINLINNLESIATQGLIPDLTFFLDIKTTESIKRREQKIDDRIEKEGIKFLENVSLGFSVIARERDWVRISAEKKNIDEISKEINSALIQMK